MGEMREHGVLPVTRIILKHVAHYLSYVTPPIYKVFCCNSALMFIALSVIYREPSGRGLIQIWH